MNECKQTRPGPTWPRGPVVGGARKRLLFYRVALTRLPAAASCAGSLPPSWGQLSRLDFIWLADNKLTGRLPPELRNTTRLGAIVLSRNQLSGPLPDPSDLHPWLALLNIADNKLTGKLGHWALVPVRL